MLHVPLPLGLSSASSNADNLHNCLSRLHTQHIIFTFLGILYGWDGLTFIIDVGGCGGSGGGGGSRGDGL